MCLFTTCHDYKGKRSHEASEEMLVNLKEFNSRLAEHGSEGKLAAVNHRILYCSHKDNISEQPDNQSLTCADDHKDPNIHKNSCEHSVFQMCINAFRHTECIYILLHSLQVCHYRDRTRLFDYLQFMFCSYY